MPGNDSADELGDYAAQVLAGTGLSTADVTGLSAPAEGTAAQALREGWRVADRAARIAGV